MAQWRADNAAADAFVPRKHYADRSSRSDCGLLAGNKRLRPVMRFRGRRIDVPTDADIGGDTGRDAVVVLRKERCVPGAQVRDIRRVLLKSADLAGQEVSKRNARAGGRGGREADFAIVIQIGKEHGLVERELTAKGQVVLALCQGDHVTYFIVVGTRDGACIRVTRVKAGAGELGQCGRSLDGEVRAETGEGLVGVAAHRDHGASAHGPRKRDPGLIGQGGGEGVNVADVGIRLS